MSRPSSGVIRENGVSGMSAIEQVWVGAAQSGLRVPEVAVRT